MTAPSNIAVDNIVNKIISEGFCDGEGRRYYPSIIRVGRGQKGATGGVSLEPTVQGLLRLGLDEVERQLWELRATQQQIEMDSILIRNEFRKTVEWIKGNNSSSVTEPAFSPPPPPPDTPEEFGSGSSNGTPQPPGMSDIGTPQPPPPDTPNTMTTP